MTETNEPQSTFKPAGSDEPNHTQRRRLLIAGGAAVVAALIGVTLAISLGGDDQASPAPATTTSAPTPAASPAFTDPGTLADQFAAYYASGDTPAAAQLASGDALTALSEHGWDRQTAPWSASVTPISSCSLPSQAGATFAAVYMTSALVDGHRGVEIAISKTDAGYTVSKVYARSEQSLCSIYGGGGG